MTSLQTFRVFFIDEKLRQKNELVKASDKEEARRILKAKKKALVVNVTSRIYA
jgi:hypothetical protein